MAHTVTMVTVHMTHILQMHVLLQVEKQYNEIMADTDVSFDAEEWYLPPGLVIMLYLYLYFE